MHDGVGRQPCCNFQDVAGRSYRTNLGHRQRYYPSAGSGPIVLCIAIPQRGCGAVDEAVLRVFGAATPAPYLSTHRSLLSKTSKTSKTGSGNYPYESRIAR